ncbi:MAG: PE-PPE domain-containing protein [Mycolicibacterium sp.]|uniref:PE-PPE domain-containing protein n=1 Tax=Mycolicibacterium sp. TaxID=2320850 RepID=UPI003D0E7260
MRDVIRTAGVALCAPVTAAVLLAASTTTAQSAAPPVPDYPGGVDCQQESCTALILGGAWPTNNLSDAEMSSMLGGYFTDYKRVNIVHPGLNPSINVPAGALRLGNALDTTSGPITVAGFSQGALVADQIMRELAEDADAPSASELNFVIISDPTRGPLITAYGDSLAFLGYDRMPPPESQYDVIVVAVEYDGVADAPDRWWNLLAVTNAYFGGMLLHVDSMNVDLSQVPEEDITVGPPNSRGGVTTTYLIRTEKLPLVQVMPFLAPLEEQLKKQVDAGYSRNDGKAAVANSVQSLAAEADVESPATVAEETETASRRSANAVQEAESDDDAPQDVEESDGSGADTDEFSAADVEVAETADSGDADAAEGTDGGKTDDIAGGTDDTETSAAASANDDSEGSAGSQEPSSKPASEGDSDS